MILAIFNAAIAFGDFGKPRERLFTRGGLVFSRKIQSFYNFPFLIRNFRMRHKKFCEWFLKFFRWVLVLIVLGPIYFEDPDWNSATERLINFWLRFDTLRISDMNSYRWIFGTITDVLSEKIQKYSLCQSKD